MCARQSRASSKENFKWTKIEQDMLEEIKWIVDRNVLLAHPNFNEEIKIHTNYSGFQLEVVII